MSTALVASMAASAFAAAPKAGVYIGGNIDKYYSFTSMLANMDSFLDEMIDTVPDVLYVDKDGEAKGGNLAELLFVSNPKSHLVDVTDEMFADIDGADGFNAVNEDGTVEAVKRNPDGTEVIGTPGELKVESVSAITSKTVKVTFATALTALNKEDVTVVNKETGDKQYVQAVALSEDKKSATVDFYEALTKGTYTATVKAGEKSSSKDFDFAAGEVTKIDVNTAQTVKAGDATAISYKLLDAAGLDVTAENKSKVTFESSSTITDGKITLPNDGDIAFVYVIVTKEDGTVVKSDKITVKAEASKPVDLINWTVSTKAENFASADYKQNTTVKADGAYNFYVEFKDQFDGKSAYAGNVQYESLDKTVALVDRETGAVTPIKDGSVPVKISVVKDGKTLYSKTVEIKTVAKAVASKLELKENQITVSSSIGTTKDVEVTFKDQYGDDIAFTGKLNVKVKSGKDLIKALDAEQNVPGTTTHKFTVTPETGKEGTAVIELSLNDQVKAEVTVKVEKAGAVSDFKVAGFEKQLDKNTANKDAKSAMELKVYGVDEKGGQAAQITTGLFYSVKDSTGKEIATGSAASFKIDATSNDYETGKEYTVTVKLGEKAETAYQVFSDKFTVTDTQALPKVSLTKGTVDIDVSKADGDLFTDHVKLGDLFDVTFTGAKAEDITVKGFEFNSDNINVLEGTTATSAKVLKDGTASLVVKSVDVTVKVDGQDKNFTAKLDGEVLKVNVKGHAERDAAKALADAKDALTAKIGEAKALVEADYTPESYAVLADAIGKGEALDNSTDVDAIKAATKAIADAVTALETV